jgi:hypothetical protein
MLPQDIRFYKLLYIPSHIYFIIESERRRPKVNVCEIPNLYISSSSITKDQVSAILRELLIWKQSSLYFLRDFYIRMTIL